MAAYVKYESAMQFMMAGVIIAFGTVNEWRVVIHSDAPVVATDDELADLTQITGTGYTAGGEDVQNDGTRAGGVVTVTGLDVTWTAGAGGFVAGRYVSLYDNTSTGDKLICSWDYGANFTLLVGETFTVDFGANIFTIS